MASFTKDLQIKSFKLPSGKKRVLLSDEATTNLFLNVTQTSKAFLYIYTDKISKKKNNNHAGSLSKPK